MALLATAIPIVKADYARIISVPLLNCPMARLVPVPRIVQAFIVLQLGPVPTVLVGLFVAAIQIAEAIFAKRMSAWLLPIPAALATNPMVRVVQVMGIV